MLTYTVADVGARVVAQTSARWLEVDASLDLGQVTSSQIGRATQQVGEDGRDSGQRDFGEFSGGLSCIGDLVHREVFLPTLGKFARDTPGKFGVFLGVLLAVLGDKSVPLLLKSSAANANFVVGSICLLRNVEALIRKVELCFQLGDIIGLEGW